MNSRELPRTFDIYVHRRYSYLLRLLVWRAGSFGFPFGLLLPAAILGILTSCRHSRERTLLALLIPAYGVSHDPSFAEAHSNLGSLFMLRGNLGQAEKQFRETLYLKPCFGKAHSLLGLALLKQHRLDEAIASFREAIAYDPFLFEPRAQLAEILATHPDDQVRNGTNALNVAQRMMNHSDNNMPIETIPENNPLDISVATGHFFRVHP